jgi:hypothetical protein
MSTYKYFGIELTPNVFSDLLILLFDGKQFDRNSAIETIMNYHKDNGGILYKKDYISVFKKASKNLSGNGMTNVGYGIWRLNYQKDEVEVVIDKSTDEKILYNADLTIGKGENFVYVYYYNTYKKYAEINGLKSWECKIGRSENNPLQRIFSQSGTCYPELPHIALIIRCDNSLQLETTIHNILKCRGKWIDDAPGTEWFFTFP